MVVVGSQSVLVDWPDAPALMRTSGEIDAYPANARLLERGKPGYEVFAFLDVLPPVPQALPQPVWSTRAAEPPPHPAGTHHAFVDRDGTVYVREWDAVPGSSTWSATRSGRRSSGGTASST